MHIYAFPGLWAGPFMIGFGTASEQGEGKTLKKNKEKVNIFFVCINCQRRIRTRIRYSQKEKIKDNKGKKERKLVHTTHITLKSSVFFENYNNLQ